MSLCVQFLVECSALGDELHGFFPAPLMPTSRNRSSEGLGNLRDHSTASARVLAWIIV
jgi:hypothetical protein